MVAHEDEKDRVQSAGGQADGEALKKSASCSCRVVQRGSLFVVRGY